MQLSSNRPTAIIFSALISILFCGTLAAQTCPVDQAYTCSSSDDGSQSVCSCDDSNAKPSKCDAALNSVWIDAQDRVDHVIRLPICEQYWGSWLDTSANIELNEIQAQTKPEKAATKYRVVTRKRIQRLKRRASACRR